MLGCFLGVARCSVSLLGCSVCGWMVVLYMVVSGCKDVLCGCLVILCMVARVYCVGC